MAERILPGRKGSLGLFQDDGRRRKSVADMTAGTGESVQLIT